MDANQPAGAMPENRRSLTPSNVFGLLDVYTKADPARDKRANLLKSYFRHPHAARHNDTCVLDRPANANYGLLAFLVDKQKKIYMDMIRNRVSAFSVKVDDGVEFDGLIGPEMERERRRWSSHITWAFENYCIRRWNRYDNMMSVVVLNMLLFARGPLWWRDAATMDCRAVYAGDVLVPPGSSQIPEDWDSLFVICEMPYHELWERREQPNWNKKAVDALLMANAPESEQFNTLERWTRGMEDGTLSVDPQAKRNVRIAWFYQRQADGRISCQAIPHSGFPSVATGGGEKAKCEEFLYERADHAESFDQIIGLIIDNPALGSFYKTPSFAEGMYVATNLYDDRMNMAGNAAAMNCMLILQGGDESVFRRQNKLKLRDRIWLPPGTTPAQVRFTLPVEESMSFAQAIYQQSLNSAGASQIGAVNDMGGKTPKSATQSWFDGKTQESIQSADLKAFSVALNPWGAELYRRFTSMSDAEPNKKLSHGFKLFKRYLESKGVPAKAWKPENVEIASRLLQNAGSPASQLQNAMVTMDLLDRRPSSPGQALALKEALIAVHGADGVDDFVEDSEFRVADNEDRLIGHENEQLRDAGAKAENIPVLATDNHVKHLFGMEVDGTVPGHLADAWETALEAQKFLQMVPDPADEGLYLDKLANMVTEMEAKLKHCATHVAMLSKDPGKAAYMEKAIGIVQQMEKILGGMAGAFQKLQQKRAQRLAEERAAQQQAADAGNMERQKKEEEIELARQSGDIKLANELMAGHVKRENMRLDGELKRQQAAADVAFETGAKAAKSASGGGSGPKEPKEPKQPKSK
jgi:hypothetical protein